MKKTKVNINKRKKDLQALLDEYLAKEERMLDDLTKKEREAVGHSLKSIKTLDRFKANGQQYVIHTSLAVSRFEQFEKLEVEVGWGTSFEAIFGNMRKAFDSLNESMPADASAILYNSMNGIKNKLEGRKNPILLLCSLFISREGEDITKYDPAVNALKIEDWTQEGITMESFFSLAFNLVNGFDPIYKEVSAGISRRKKRKGKK